MTPGISPEDQAAAAGRGVYVGPSAMQIARDQARLPSPGYRRGRIRDALCWAIVVAGIIWIVAAALRAAQVAGGVS